MIHLGAASLALVLFIGLPEVLRGWRLGSASPRLLAMAYLVALVGLAVLPAVWLTCLGAGLIEVISSGRPLSGVCWLGLNAGAWRVVAYGVALSTLVPVIWQAVRVLDGTWSVELRGLALAGASERHLRGGASAWVVPSQEVAAYAAGVLRPRAVVTSGLLALLRPDEREAVLEHEGAHVRFGHPRLLLLGAVVAGAYGFVPAISRAWAGLTRELEAAADDEAARLVGSAPLLSALARVGLTHASVGAASFADVEHLRYRIRRLQEPCRSDQRASTAAGALSAVLIVAFSWSLCSLLANDPTVVPLALCALAVGAVGLRPLWSWGRSVDSRPGGMASPDP